MDTELLSSGLRAAVADVQPRYGFADEVTGGARRLVRHRRITAGALAVALVAAVTGGAVLIGRGIGDPPVAALPDLLSLPTGGDLAGDRQFVAAAEAAWRAALPASPNADHYTGRMLGKPHVYWAGNTPSGPAAVVAQQVRQAGVALGLYGEGLSVQMRKPGPGRILTDVPPVNGPARIAFQFGTGDLTMLAMDPGQPMLLSTGPRHETDGRVIRAWQPLSVVDGVALWQAPAGTDASAVRVALATKTGGPDRDAAVATLPASRYDDGFEKQSTYRAEHRLDWRSPRVIIVDGTTNARPVVTTQGIEGHLERAGLLDPFMRMGAAGHWDIAAALPDGRTAWVTEYQQDSAPSRVYAVIGDGWRVVDGGPVDPAAPLPVKVKLPNQLGWVVAAYGSALRYRTTADGPWTDAGRDAAVLPHDATAVEVTAPAGTLALVPLDR